MAPAKKVSQKPPTPEFKSPKSLKELLEAKEEFLMDFEDFINILAAEKKPLALRAWAEREDPKLSNYQKALEKDCTFEELLGGITIDTTTILFYSDPNDGYRSHNSNVRVLPDFELSTTLPYVPVIFEKERKTREESFDIFHFVAKDTGESIIQFGTDYSDGYYPMATFDVNPQALTKAIPFATVAYMEKEFDAKNKVSLRSSIRPHKI